MHACKHAGKYVYACMHGGHVCMCTCMHAGMCVCMHAWGARMYACMRGRMYVCFVERMELQGLQRTIPYDIYDSMQTFTVNVDKYISTQCFKTTCKPNKTVLVYIILVYLN